MQRQLKQHGVAYDLYGRSYDFVTNFDGGDHHASCGLKNDEKICDVLSVNDCSYDDVC